MSRSWVWQLKYFKACFLFFFFPLSFHFFIWYFWRNISWCVWTKVEKWSLAAHSTSQVFPYFMLVTVHWWMCTSPKWRTSLWHASTSLGRSCQHTVVVLDPMIKFFRIRAISFFYFYLNASLLTVKVLFFQLSSRAVLSLSFFLVYHPSFFYFDTSVFML